MHQKTATRQIVDGSRRAGKTYEFADQHDETQPTDLWFQESHEGLVLFLELYSQACRWSRCLGCSLPSKASRTHVPFHALMAQVDKVFQHPEVVRKGQQVNKIILSNNGSMLDEVTFSSTALMYLLAKINLHLPQLQVLSIETRPEFVDLAELELIARALNETDEPSTLEIAIGFEALDDHLRNEVFNKGLTLEAFEHLAEQVAPYGYHLKCYFMLKPVPEISDEQAIADIHRAIEYLSDTAERHQVVINLHLNPTYVARGTVLAAAFAAGTYRPPSLLDVARALQPARQRPLSVYIGLVDEGLAVPGGSFLRPGDEQLIDALHRFNRTQDYTILDQLVAMDRSAPACQAG